MKICPQCLESTADGADWCPHDATALLALGDATKNPLIGTVAGDRFLLLDELGSGGMGIVFRGFQLSMSRHVAVKVLSWRSVQDQIFVERFIREAKSTAQLRSPHTVIVHDFGQLESGELFLAMELLTGPSLEMVIHHARKLAPERACKLTDQVCASLEEAHALGMIHRDIKPRNIIIEDSGSDRERAKVLDFGLVKLSEGTEDELGKLTRPGVIHGTPAYMAPEMWSRDFGEVTPATDIYALGVVMFEMLAGTLPFSAPGVPMFLHKHIYEAPPALPGASHDPSIAALDLILQRCLMKRPEQRFQSIRELRGELARIRSLPDSPPRDDLSTTEHGPEVGFADTIASSWSSAHAGGKNEQPTVESQPTEEGELGAKRNNVLALPPAKTEPQQTPPRAPGRLPLMLGALACTAALAGGALFVRTNDPAVKAADARSAVEKIEKTSAPIAVSQTASSTSAPPAQAATPSKASTKRAASRPAVRISEPRVVGALDRQSARDVFTTLEPHLRACYKKAAPSRNESITLHIFVQPNGSTNGVRVTPADDDGARFRACIEPTAMTKTFGAFEGPFSTVSVVLEP